jgi:hypothetical protein
LSELGPLEAEALFAVLRKSIRRTRYLLDDLQDAAWSMEPLEARMFRLHALQVRTLEQMQRDGLSPTIVVDGVRCRIQFPDNRSVVVS